MIEFQSGKRKLLNFPTSFLRQLPVFILAACYPLALDVFSWFVQSHGQNETFFFKLITVVGATLSMLLTFLIPLMAIRKLVKMERKPQGATIALRRILHLVFASSPIYTLLLLVLNKIGLAYLHNLLWTILVLIYGIAFIFYLKRPKKKAVHAIAKPIWVGWRTIHGVAALFFLLGFALLHIFNHGMALWSVELHQNILETLRKWYLSPWVEPLLLLFIGVLIVSGVRISWHHTRFGGDFFRILQTTSGVYLFFFLSAHSLAVLSAQVAGVETDWYYATGASGLIVESVMLFPYYTMAVFFILTHASLGLRKILIDRNIGIKPANRVFYRLMVISAIVTIGIGMASTGIGLDPTAEVEEASSANQERLRCLLENGLLKIDRKLDTGIEGFKSDRYLNILEVTLAPLSTEPLHTHPGAEVLYALEGKGHVVLDSTVHPMVPGSVVHVKRGQKKALGNTSASENFKVLAFLVLERDYPSLELCN